MSEYDWTAKFYSEDRYQYSKLNKLSASNMYLSGFTHEDISEYITQFPFIYEIYKKNKPSAQWKLIDELMKTPSESDGPGFIYGFMNEAENSLLEAPYWIKMGRTKQYPPQQRIFQWQKDDQIQITQIFTVRSLFHKKLQNLVHTLFTYARQRRVINGKERIEWFKFEEITLTAAAVNILNHVMNTIHISKMEKKGGKIYLNRNLKEISEKLGETNKKIMDLQSISVKDVAESAVRDIGIECGKNISVKIELENAKSLQQAVVCLRNMGMGRQIEDLVTNIKVFEEQFAKCSSKLEQFKNMLFLRMRQLHEKTKISFFNNGNKYQQQRSQEFENQETIKQDLSRFARSEKRSNSRSQNKEIKAINSQNREHKGGEKSKKQERRKKKKELYVHSSSNDKNSHGQSLNKSQSIMNKLKQLRTQQQKSKEKEEGSKSIKKRGDTSRGESQTNRYSTRHTQLISRKSTEKKNIYNFPSRNADLDKSLNQSIVVNLKQEIRLSEQLSITPMFNRNYIIVAQTVYLDIHQLRLDAFYLVGARKVVVSEKLCIKRNNNERENFKGFLKIYCSEIQNFEEISIRKNCEKYVGIYRIEEKGRITGVDQYHKKQNKISETDRQAANNFFQNYSILYEK